jgi:hypothetical protein
VLTYTNLGAIAIIGYFVAASSVAEACGGSDE